MADTTIADALLLLSKVSSSTDKRLSLLEKVLGKSATSASNREGSNKTPRQVVEKAKPVIVTDFGKKAENDLKVLQGNDEGGKEGDPGKDSGGMGFIKKLIGPALLVLGGLAALVTGIMSDGPLKGLLNILSKGGIIAGVKLFQKMAGKQLAKFTGLFSKLIPKDLFAGVITKAKGFLGSITKFLLAPFKKLAGKGGAKALFGTIGKLFSKLLKPLLKRIPGIGSLISWGFAVSRFKKGDLVGGLIDVASGIATLFPGIGTGISIGLDVLNAFMDAKKDPEEVKPAGSGFKIGDFFGKLKDKIMNNYPVKNLISMWDGAKKVLSGDVKGGLTDMAMAIPFMKPLADFFFGEKNEETGEREGGMQGKSFSEILKVIGSTLKEKVGRKLLSVIPAWGGFRKRAAALLGISIDDTGGGVEDLPEAEQVALMEAEVKADSRKNTKKSEDIDIQEQEASNSSNASGFYQESAADNTPSLQNDSSRMQLKIAQAHSNLIKKQTDMSGELLTTQIELLRENISLLREIAEKTGVGANIVTNNTTSVTNMNNQRNIRELQHLYST